MQSEGGSGLRPKGLPGRGEDVSEIEQGISVLAEQVGLRSKRGRGACEFHCLAMEATVSEDPGRQSLADDLGRPVLAGGSCPADREQIEGLVVSVLALRCDGPGEFGCGAGEDASLTHSLEEVILQAQLRRYRRDAAATLIDFTLADG